MTWWTGAVDIETENSIKQHYYSRVEGIHDQDQEKWGTPFVDVHLEIDGNLSVKVGHDIAVLARNQF